LTSRGCPYHCVYCQASKQWEKIRYHSPEYVVNEIKYLVDTYDLDVINIIDDLFVSDTKRLTSIVGSLEKEVTKKIKFCVNGRANLMNEERFELIKKMNVVQVAIGFESASERILQYLKGGTVTVAQNENVLALARRYDMPIGAQFMLGTPGETEEDMMATFDFIKRHRSQMSHININITTPLPGTQLWEAAKQRGLVSEDMDWTKLTIAANPSDNIYLGDLTRQDFLRICTMIIDYCAPANTMRPQDYLKHFTVSKIMRELFLHPRSSIKLIGNSLKKELVHASKGAPESEAGKEKKS